jgi:hypothetical protein
MDRFEQIINIRRELRKTFGKIKKEGFPIPSPTPEEKKDEYISRCISSIIDEYGQEQSSGICYDIWDKEHP